MHLTGSFGTTHTTEDHWNLVHCFFFFQDKDNPLCDIALDVWSPCLSHFLVASQDLILPELPAGLCAHQSWKLFAELSPVRLATCAPFFLSGICFLVS